jgi:hypothetical protein
MTSMTAISFEAWTRILTLAGAVVAFAWGVYQFSATQASQAETRRIEATRPFLDRQLKLYTDATQSTATIATSASTADIAAATLRFWSLYWGELALVEDRRVEAAMVAFGNALNRKAASSELQQLSLALARACRDSLSESWGVRQWRNPWNTATQ